MGILFALGIPFITHAQRLEVARFSAEDMSAWENKSFVGETRYKLRKDGDKKSTGPKGYPSERYGLVPAIFT